MTAALNVLLLVLIIVFITVGVYLLLVLTEFRDSLRRSNRVIDKANSLLEFVENTIVKPTSALAGYLGLLRELVNFAAKFKKNVAKTDGETSEDKK